MLLLLLKHKTLIVFFSSCQEEDEQQKRESFYFYSRIPRAASMRLLATVVALWIWAQETAVSIRDLQLTYRSFASLPACLLYVYRSFAPPPPPLSPVRRLLVAVRRWKRRWALNEHPNESITHWLDWIAVMYCFMCRTAERRLGVGGGGDCGWWGVLNVTNNWRHYYIEIRDALFALYSVIYCHLPFLMRRPWPFLAYIVK